LAILAGEAGSGPRWKLEARGKVGWKAENGGEGVGTMMSGRPVIQGGLEEGMGREVKKMQWI
jgi:hypothetical protein